MEDLVISATSGSVMGRAHVSLQALLLWQENHREMSASKMDGMQDILKIPCPDRRESTSILPQCHHFWGDSKI